MFSEEDEHGIVEHMDISKRRLMRALTLVMENAGRHIPVLIAPLKQTIRQVYVLAIHEEIFIEQPSDRQVYVAHKNGKTVRLSDKKGWNTALFSGD